jgi:hypothetical protein
MLSLPLTVLGGRVVNVPADRTLSSALSTAQVDDEIIIAPGTYTLTAYPSISAAGVTVRGASGNPADVIVQGLGMNVDPGGATKEGFNLYANDITIKDLTVQEFFNHAIHFGVNIYRPKILNVITRNNGQQHIKGAKYNYDGLIENTICEQTYVRTNMLPSDPRGEDYVGGIDLHGGSTFVIRDCIVRNIMGAGGDADGSIFAWNQSSNITVERCMVTGGNRAICFGNNSGGSLGYDVDGGIIRNCFIYARTGTPTDPDEPWTGNADIGIDLAHVRNVNVYNNTVWTNSGTYGRTIQIYDKASRRNENLTLAYNIWRGSLSDQAGGPFTLTGNITGNTPQASWFFDAANANYHLTKLATTAIDHAVLLADVPTDYDQQTRPIGSLPDVGADEYVAADITGDGHVDAADLLIVAGSFGKSSGQPGYNAAADLKVSNAIDVSDVLVLAGSWGL